VDTLALSFAVFVALLAVLVMGAVVAEKLTGTATVLRALRGIPFWGIILTSTVTGVLVISVESVRIHHLPDGVFVASVALTYLVGVPSYAALGALLLRRFRLCALGQLMGVIYALSGGGPAIARSVLGCLGLRP